MSRRVALVASPGGHCDQLYEVADRFGSREERFWITARTPQTIALLAEEDVEWVPPVWSRQARQALTSVGRAVAILRRRQPTHLASTGAALSVPFMLTARALGVQVTYLESATRLAGPSVSGRIMERVPGVRLYRQAAEWDKPRRRWRYLFSIFDGYECEVTSERRLEKVLVTVGSERFGFPRAVDMVRSWAENRELEMTWQTGHTTVADDLPGVAKQWWPGDELARKARASDIVITHAGVGSILTVLRSGACPVVIARSARSGEHIDDHQEQLAQMLESRGLVVVARSRDDLPRAVEEALRRRIVRPAAVPTFTNDV